MTDENLRSIVDNTADFAPLGFMGLGLAATMLGLMGSGFFTDATMVVSMSIFLGGFAQVFAGIQGWKKGDVFGATAFSAFGLFWFSFAFILMSAGLASGVLGAASAASVGFYLLIWGMVSLVLLLVTFKIGIKAIIVVFVTLTLTFFLNAAVNFGVGVGPLAGYMTLMLGISALYTSLALVANSVFGKTVAPL
ncbi:acetate uptake transporter [Methanococcoides methylutens]|uniref:acetate uptake transporter n=1 Tax=Methanococcoides methylutens TaxID=2226 RepID=UPI00404511B4